MNVVGIEKISKPILCKCGCGQKVKPGNRFILGHNGVLLKGRKQTLEHIKKRKEGRGDYKHSEETKRKIGEGNRGKVRSLETRRKIGEVNRGKRLSELTKKKIGDSNRGRKHTKEAKRKISESLRERIVSTETRKKISKGHKGKKLSFEHREKLSKIKILAIKKGKYYPGRYKTDGVYLSKKNGKKLHYRSLLELGWYQLLEQMEKVEWYEVEPVAIPYLWEGSIHSYLPDLRIRYTDGTTELVEIKPEGDYFRKEKRNQAKWKAARKWCEKRRIPTEFRVVGYEGLKNEKRGGHREAL